MKALPVFRLLAEENKKEISSIRDYVNDQVVVYLNNVVPDKDLRVLIEEAVKEDNRGDRGKRGELGRRGRRGERGVGEKGEKGEVGEKGERGEKGFKGDTGPTGPSPEHEWRDTKLRFKNPDGSWGSFVRLKGATGMTGGGGGGRSANNGFTEIVLNGSSLEFRRPSDGPLADTIVVDLSAVQGDASLAYFLGE